MTLATFRHFCATSRVLDVYLGGSVPLSNSHKLCNGIRESVTLGLRTENVRLPDHQHRNRTEKILQEQDTLADMLLLALGAKYSNGNVHGLEVHDGALYVQAAHLEDWQREVTAYQSTVPLLAAAWVRHCRRQGHPMSMGVKDLARSLQHSSLPGVYDRRLNSLIQDEENKAGRLCDLHMHINGSTEFTSVWLHSLAHPELTLQALEKARSEGGKKVKFFLHQLRMEVKDIYTRLHMAGVLRYWLCRLLQTQDPSCALKEDLPTWESMARLLRTGRSSGQVSLKHPFSASLRNGDATDLQCEGAMWFEAVRVLQEGRSHSLAVLMHVYMLLMNQHMRLLVQQQEQYGFDQFQYITLAGGREAAEDSDRVGFAPRFRQFHGMYGPDLAHVEARFSPKKTPQDNARLLQSIWKGYGSIIQGTNGDGLVPCPACPRIARQFRLYNGEIRPSPLSAQQKGETPPSLGLVAHFIKKPDKEGGSCRHMALRDEVFAQANALVAARNSFSRTNLPLYNALVGKDAASNELEASPEVFAPAFRYLHRQGITHTTYHAGEDFEHVLCGMRAVHEAMIFLDMSSGDRIGHATALGIAPEQCFKGPVHCSQGKWLDNLVWLTWVIERTPSLSADFGGQIARLHPSITRLYLNIYGKERKEREERCPELPVLWRAWELRKYDVRMVSDEKLPVHQNSRCERQCLEKEKVQDGKGLYNKAKIELCLYHTQPCCKAWGKVITISPEELPSDALLRALQDAIILEMCNKNILVEVLPTSNVRISHYTATDQHHIMRWLNQDDPRPTPQIVLGTDDPGIFSTTLRNEYALILHKLKSVYQAQSERPYEVIRHLIDNSKSYRF